MFFPVILSGGAGTRLWPLSRQLYPKQFLPLLSEETMFQQTIERLHGLDWHELIVVCNEEHRFLAAEQLRRVGIKNAKIILEPVPKNTAPAIALAAYEACEKDKNAILLVLPADHVIKDHKKFQASVKIATKAVKNGKLVTFGIIPDSPKTGYGYIRRGEKLEEGIFSVDAFVEKPDVRKAHEYQKSGMYFWNSGMFLFSAKSYIDELQKFAPTIASTCEKAMSKAEKDLDFLRIARDVFEDCPSDSIDFSVMEKTRKAAVVPLDAGWSDIGSWDALLEVCEKDKKGNSIKGDVVNIDTENCLVYAEDRLVTALGVKNLIIVETKDAFLVMDKGRSEAIKTILEQLEATSRTEIVNHREVHRPWGVYDSIAKGERFQVKRITVKPGGKFSLQKHYHRAEHWVIVKGTAEVTLEDKVFTLAENESTFIPIGKVHSLENPGKIPLELIEVQSGSYLSEDDIVRLEDVYRRI